MTPKATPQTATRMTRSNSPPTCAASALPSARRRQDRDEQRQPYMWIVSGPMWTTPLCGEGMYPSRATISRHSADRDARLLLERA